MPGSGMDTLAAAMFLRTSLQVLAPLLVVGAVVALGLAVLTGHDASPLGSVPALAALIGVAALALSPRSLTLGQLRAMEIVLVVAAAALLALPGGARIEGDLLAGNAAAARASWNLTVLHFTLLIIVYGVFLPGALRWTGAVLGALAVVPFALVLLLRARHPGAAELVSPILAPGSSAAAVLQLGLGAAAAVLGGRLLGRTRAAYAKGLLSGMYDLIERIGSGGMGEVWLARHQILARPAAIKLIRPELLGREDAPRVLRRFEREAQATAQLKSQHTVSLYDYGVSHTGVFYYVMEYLDGMDLATLVERFGPVSAGRAIHLLKQVCESLADAHHAGLVHRDIKPANIHVCRHGLRNDYVKVLDFGLVKSEGEDGFDTKLTMEGTVTGSPAFMAPEMATTKGPIDPRTDLYALGCVGYWLLTGKPPFESETAMGMIVEHAKTDPVPPSRRTEIAVPEELDRIVLRCLEKDPGKRFQSARELSAALAACPVPEPWTEERAEKWWTTHFPAGEGGVGRVPA